MRRAGLVDLVRGLAVALGVSVTLAACADPVIELSFQLPASGGPSFDPSCVTAVDVYTDGVNYPASPNDYLATCVELSGGYSDFAALTAALRGKIDLALPASGLAAVEMYGRRGTCQAFDGQIVFYAAAPHIGQDQLELPIHPVSSCELAPVTIRPVDLLALTTGASRGDCTQARAIDDPVSSAIAGTLTQSLYGVVFDTSFSTGAMLDGAVRVPGAPATVGPRSCIAVRAIDPIRLSISCVDPSASPACAGPGELEAPFLDDVLAFDSTDPTRSARLPYVVWGAVVDGNRQPIAGATVQIDPKRGEVVYLDPTATRLEDRGGTSTGPSGLFVVYASGLVDITVSAGGKSRVQTIGTSGFEPGAALVVLR